MGDRWARLEQAAQKALDELPEGETRDELGDALHGYLDAAAELGAAIDHELADVVVRLEGEGPWPGWDALTARSTRAEVEADRRDYVEIVEHDRDGMRIGLVDRVDRPWVLLLPRTSRDTTA